jgi:hypothetical protein
MGKKERKERKREKKKTPKWIHYLGNFRRSETCRWHMPFFFPSSANKT